MSFEYLLHRTETHIRWDVTRLNLKEEAIAWGVGLRTGAVIKDTAQADSEPDLDSMSDAERVRFYMDACKEAGMEVDPAVFSVENSTGTQE